MSGGVLFVDDDLENVALAAEIVEEAAGREVAVVASVERAVELLLEQDWTLVVMDLFIPLGDHPHRVLGPRARRYQEHVDHLAVRLNIIPMPPIDLEEGLELHLTTPHILLTGEADIRFEWIDLFQLQS